MAHTLFVGYSSSCGFVAIAFAITLVLGSHSDQRIGPGGPGGIRRFGSCVPVELWQVRDQPAAVCKT